MRSWSSTAVVWVGTTLARHQGPGCSTNQSLRWSEGDGYNMLELLVDGLHWKELLARSSELVSRNTWIYTWNEYSNTCASSKVQTLSGFTNIMICFACKSMLRKKSYIFVSCNLKSVCLCACVSVRNQHKLRPMSGDFGFNIKPNARTTWNDNPNQHVEDT